MIDIASERHVWLLAFLPFWLAGWTAGGVFLLIELLRGQPTGGATFSIIWLVFWAGAWAFATYAWLWTAFGKEVIGIASGVLTIKRDVFGRGPKKAFPAHEILNIRPIGFFGRMMTWEGGLAYWGLTGGTVAFDWRGRTHRFGIQLEEHEARDLVELLRPCLPEAASDGFPSPGI